MAALVHSSLGKQISFGPRATITTRRGESGWPLFGPYVDLGAGRYSVAFAIAVTDAPAGGSDDICGRVDVCAGYGDAVVVQRNFRQADLAHGPVSVDFELTEPACCEFRVWVSGLVGISVAVERRLTADPDNADNPGQVFRTIHADKLKDLTNKGATITPSRLGAWVELFGMTMHLQTAQDFNEFQEVMVRNLFTFHAGKPCCVIDVAMGMGLASLYLAKPDLVRAVHGFEADPARFARAMEHLALNPALATKVVAHPFGLGRTGEGPVRGLLAAGLDIRDACDGLGPIMAKARHDGLRIVIRLDCAGWEVPILERLAEGRLLGDISTVMLRWYRQDAGDRTRHDLVRLLLDAHFVVFDHTGEADHQTGTLFAIRKRSLSPAAMHSPHHDGGPATSDQVDMR